MARWVPGMGLEIQVSSVRMSLSKSSLGHGDPPSPDFAIPGTDAGTFVESCTEFTSTQEKLLKSSKDPTEDSLGFKNTTCPMSGRKYHEPLHTVGSPLHPGP